MYKRQTQTEGLFKVSDFVPVPCCFPTCNSVTYAFVDGDTVLPLTRVLNVEDYLDYITNRILPDLGGELKAALESLWSSSAVPGSEKAAQSFALSCAACGLPDGKPIPFCAYNNVGYRQQARAQLMARQRERERAKREGAPYTPKPLTFTFGQDGRAK